MKWLQKHRARSMVVPGLEKHGAGSWLPEAEMPAALPIAQLVYPLRYDIVVRMRLFEAYAAERERYRTDPAAFVELACDHDYHIWFERVMMVRRADYIAHHHLTPDDIFTDCVHQAAELYESIVGSGFDAKRPIVPFTGREILPADSGAVSAEQYFPGDGCHRLACLMSLGHTTLPATFFRIKRFDRLQPFDNTRLLREHLDINWPDFAKWNS